MTRADVFNDALGRAHGLNGRWAGSQSPSLFWNDTRYDPANNTLLMPASEDDRLMATGEAQYELMDKLFKRTKANQQQREVNFLKSMLAQPDVNIYGKATNPDELHAQKLVEDYRVGADKGIAAITAAYEYNRDRAMKETQLAQARTNLRNSQRKQQMEEGLYPTQRKKGEADLQKARSDIEKAKADMASNAYYKQATLEDRRAAAQTAIERQAQAEVDRQMTMNDRQAERQQTNKEQQYKLALDEVVKGRMDPNQLVGRYPLLDRNDYMLLNDQAQNAAKERQGYYDKYSTDAMKWTGDLQSAIESARQAKQDTANRNQWFWNRLAGNNAQIPPADMAALDARTLQNFEARTAKDRPAGIRYQPGASGAIGGYAPDALPPRQFTPLDIELLKQRGIRESVMPGSEPAGSGFYDRQTPVYDFYGQPTSQPTGPGYYAQPAYDQPTSRPFQPTGGGGRPLNLGQVPVIKSKADAQTYSSSPLVQNSAGQMIRNPYWNGGVSGSAPDVPGLPPVGGPAPRPLGTPTTMPPPRQMTGGDISPRALYLVTRLRQDGYSEPQILRELANRGWQGEAGGMVRAGNPYADQNPYSSDPYDWLSQAGLSGEPF